MKNISYFVIIFYFKIFGCDARNRTFTINLSGDQDDLMAIGLEFHEQSLYDEIDPLVNDVRTRIGKVSNSAVHIVQSISMANETFNALKLLYADDFHGMHDVNVDEFLIKHNDRQEHNKFKFIANTNHTRNRLIFSSKTIDFLLTVKGLSAEQEEKNSLMEIVHMMKEELDEMYPKNYVPIPEIEKERAIQLMAELNYILLSDQEHLRTIVDLKLLELSKTIDEILLFIQPLVLFIHEIIEGL